jgi:spermidine synthase
MTELSAKFAPLAELNSHSFEDSRVTVVNADAYVWLDSSEIEPFDVAIVDFPDPNNFALGKLYTTRFYNLLKSKLKPDSSVVIQTTSPLIARKSYWCIIKTLEAAGFQVKPFQTTVPSFGIWGYALAKLQPFETPKTISQNLDLKFLNNQTLVSMFNFSSDTSLPDEEIEINRLDNQVLVRYYEAEWRRFE